MPARVLRRTNVTHRDAPKLALPFAALGLTGGWLTGRLTIGSSSSEQYIAWLLCLFTPAVCALLGESLRSRTQKTWVARTVLSTLTAGMVNGLVIGMFLGAVVGMVVGLVAGFFFSLPFLPAVLAVTGAGRKVGRASRGSIVDATDRRGIWVWTAVSIALASLCIAAGRTGQGSAAMLAVVSLAGVAIAFSFDAADLAHARRVALLTEGLERRDRRPASLVAVDAQCIDLGMGDATFDERVASPAPYRELDKVVRVVRGEPGPSLAAVRAALVRDTIALVLTSGAAITHLLLIRITCRG